MARFVLASSSVNRKEILERAGIEFTVIVSNADESNGPKAPDALVKELSGRVHTVFTGVCMAYHGERVSFSQETKVKFYPLTESEIAAYVQSGEPMGKAGGYGIQGPAALFVEGIEGDYNNIFGLPAAHVMQEAKKLLKADKI